MIDNALNLTRMGFYVFPLIENSKLPAIKRWPAVATKDEKTIKEWWAIDPNYNIGIYCDKFEDGALVVVDVDNKNGKKGDETCLTFDEPFPNTLSQSTPHNGCHYIYKHKSSIRQGVDILGPGIDIRSGNGYIVGPGSIIDGKKYQLLPIATESVAQCPQWILDRCSIKSNKNVDKSKIDVHKNVESLDIDQQYVINQATHYLDIDAPVAIEYEGGDITTFKVACRLKDKGLSLESAIEALWRHWNPRCQPPWDYDELEAKVKNAYAYGTQPIGCANTLAVFTPIIEPVTDIDRLNHTYAFIVLGNQHRIMMETSNSYGQPQILFLKEETFHKSLAHEMTQAGDKIKPLTRVWVTDPRRRSYAGLCFMPGQEAPKDWYNLWTGFKVPRLQNPILAENSLNAFKEHALLNVCDNDPKLYSWLMSFFAHMIQKPWEKPLVALVFKGEKGVGKNALIDRVGHLLGPHYLLTASRDQFLGRFNSHMENLVLLTLNEAVWSGDHAAASMLKELITGDKHNIERKGMDIYSVKNCVRICIMGNEKWLVPASGDERRFAVFNVGDGRKQDRKFFEDMRVGMEQGGYKLLLDYLMNYKIDADINGAPNTKGLAEQKLASLDPVAEWWLDCLKEGKISVYDNEWPVSALKSLIWDSFIKSFQDRNIRSRIINKFQFGREFKKLIPKLGDTTIRADGEITSAYRIPPLEECRKNWEDYLNYKMDWE